MDDGALWLAYETSSSDRQKDNVARRIVEFHMGFIRWYAQKTAFHYWPAHVKEEYVAELVIICLVRIPLYNRKRLGHEDRVASFPTYLKPYLQGVRWEISAREAPLRVGRDTRRMRANAQRFIREQEQLGIDPTWDAVAVAVGKAHGRKMSGNRVKRITNPPAVVSGDVPIGDSDESLWNSEALLVPSPEQIVVDAAAKEEAISDVRQALTDLKLTPLENAILSHRLTCAPGEKLSHKDLAKMCSVSAAEVSRLEKSLIARLRNLLS